MSDSHAAMAAEIERLTRELYEANVAGAQVTKAYKALQIREVHKRPRTVAESIDIADWPYPPEWDAQQEFVSELESNICFLNGRLEKSMLERDQACISQKKAEDEREAEHARWLADTQELMVRQDERTDRARAAEAELKEEHAKRKLAEAAQAVMVKALEYYAANLTSEGGNARRALANLTPEAARCARIREAAEELEAFVSKKTPAPRVAKDVELDWATEFARLLSQLYKAVRGEEAEK